MCTTLGVVDRRHGVTSSKRKRAHDRVVMDHLIRTVLETNPSAKAHLAAGFVLERNAALLADDDQDLLKIWRRFKASN
jgi:hypothetical protein